MENFINNLLTVVKKKATALLMNGKFYSRLKDKF